MQTAQTKPILVVDDDSQMRAALTEAIQRLGYSAVVCGNGEDAIAKLNRSKYSLVVTDMKMPKMDGLAFLKEARRRNCNLPFLVITGFGTVENAVESMKEGAIDYLMGVRGIRLGLQHVEGDVSENARTGESVTRLQKQTCIEN